VKKCLNILLILVLFASIAFGGAIVIPPDLTKVPGFTVIISSPSPPSQAVIDQLVSFGIAEDNIIWRDTSETGSSYVAAIGSGVAVTNGVISVSGTATITIVTDSILTASAGAITVEAVTPPTGQVNLQGYSVEISSGSIVVEVYGDGTTTLVGQSSSLEAGVITAKAGGQIVQVAQSVSISAGTLTVEAEAANNIVNLTGRSLTASLGNIAVYVAGDANGIDDFNRGDGSLGSYWTTTYGNLQISNQAVVAQNPGKAVYSGRTYANNQYAEAKVTIVEDDEYVGVTVRGSTSNNSGYYLGEYYDTDYEEYLVDLVYIPVVGSPAVIVSYALGDFHSHIRLEVSGTTFTIKAKTSAGASWSTKGTVSHSGISSGYAGIWINYLGLALDDFASGDL
jgi:hypothetical protein